MKQNSLLIANLDDVLASYKQFLGIKYPVHSKGFLEREENHADGARLEATIFSILRDYGHDPKIGEVIGSSPGGVDFLCKSQMGVDFVLEATCMVTESVQNQSDFPPLGEAGFSATITHKLRITVGQKAKQLSGYNMSRVLCIGSMHIAAAFLLGKYGAKNLMTSDPQFSVPVYPSILKDEITTDLKDSCFFHLGQGGLVPCRNSISAILLVSLSNGSCKLVGLLHPQAAYPFDISLFPDIPFLKVSNWPCRDGKIQTEWVISDPSEKEVLIQEIRLTEKELKQK